MSAVKCYTRKNFMDEYTFPLHPANDFEHNGHPAEYASGHPKSWLSTYESFDFGKDLGMEGCLASASFHTALSPDQKLLAISSSSDRILVYDVVTKELRATLEGGGEVVFRPEQESESLGYTLLSSMCYDGSRGADPENSLILWDLDKHGRVLDEEEHIDVVAYATKAIDALLPDLSSTHEWTREFTKSSNLQADFEKALRKAAADHRRRHYTTFRDARLGGFGSSAFSKDGKVFVYHAKNNTTQRGMREPEELPQVIIYDIEMSREMHRLAGHTDAIMWSAISPDYQHCASASWDGTLRMYSALTGELEWATERSGGQSWTGAFSPDSMSIIWSSKGGRTVKVLKVSDGTTISTFPESVDDWCRDLQWHPAGDQVALYTGKHAYVWRPFDGWDGDVVQHFVLDHVKGWGRMTSVSTIGWLQDGRSLALEFSDGSKMVYDTATNSKEVFTRPEGVDITWVDQGFYGVLRRADEQDFYLSVDGDGKVRYWRTSVPASPSWWEKEKVQTEDHTAAKRKYPETDKYVKITKASSKRPI